MQQLKVQIKKILYFNDNNGYCICQAKNEQDYLTLKGYFDPTEGNVYEVSGSEEIDDKYGEYFKVKDIREVLPDMQEGIIKYFTSKNFPGVGRHTARTIYNFFGDQTLSILKNNPESIYDVDGIRENLQDVIYKQFSTNDLRHQINSLNLGFSDNINNKIYMLIKDVDEPMQLLKSNPYTLTGFNDENKISFYIADKIFLASDNDPYCYLRLSYAFINYFVELTYKSGDSCIDIEKLLDYVIRKVQITPELANSTLLQMISENIFLQFDKTIILNEYFRTEQYIAENLKLKQKYFSSSFSLNIDNKLDELEHKMGIIFNDQQKSAVRMALTSPVSIITGGPGTGKTTIIRAIVQILMSDVYSNLDIDALSDKISLLAPTGRASYRMMESTNFPAKTFHLQLKLSQGSNKGFYNINNKLPHDIFIIDEFSMVDMFLFRQLLEASEKHARFIILGDIDQLESIGPGSLLRDLIDSKSFPVTRLTQIYRQCDGSSISELSSNIKDNMLISPKTDKEISIINCTNNILKNVEIVFHKALEHYQLLDIQILSPMYKGEAGIDAINQILHKSSTDDFVTYGQANYYVGDKIIVLKNQYDKDIYNGDIGFIKKIINNNAKNIEDCLIIEIRNKEIILTYKELELIKHGYCISIHKSQGSEFDVVILPIINSAMLTKNLIYTAITRAKKKLIILGDLGIINDGILRPSHVRETRLQCLLKE